MNVKGVAKNILGIPQFNALDKTKQKVVLGISIATAATIIGIPFAPFVYRALVGIFYKKSQEDLRVGNIRKKTLVKPKKSKKLRTPIKDPELERLTELELERRKALEQFLRNQKKDEEIKRSEEVDQSIQPATSSIEDILKGYGFWIIPKHGSLPEKKEGEELLIAENFGGSFKLIRISANGSTQNSVSFFPEENDLEEKFKQLTGRELPAPNDSSSIKPSQIEYPTDEIQNDSDLDEDDLNAIEKKFSHLNREDILRALEFWVIEDNEIPPMFPLGEIITLAIKTKGGSYILYHRKRGENEFTVELKPSEGIGDALRRLDELVQASKGIYVEQTRENQLRDAGFVIAKKGSDGFPKYTWKRGMDMFRAEDQGNGSFYLIFISDTGKTKTALLKEDDDLKRVSRHLIALD